MDEECSSVVVVVVVVVVVIVVVVVVVVVLVLLLAVPYTTHYTTHYTYLKSSAIKSISINCDCSGSCGSSKVRQDSHVNIIVVLELVVVVVGVVNLLHFNL